MAVKVLLYPPPVWIKDKGVKSKDKKTMAVKVLLYPPL
jgi:hypothetical protein